MKVLVAYESRGGRTRRAAEAVAEAARAQGHEVTVKPVSEARGQDVEAADFLFAGCWVEGFILFGVGPAKPMRRWIEGLPRLAGKRAAVFCTYAFNPRRTLAKLREDLEAKGAEVVEALAAPGRDPEAGTAEFVRAALAPAGG